MKIKYIGHASFLIEEKNESILTDPWLSTKGAFNYSWFQYPYNHHLQKYIRNIDKKLYIYISHSHQDHLDKEFLNSLEDLDFTFLLPKFQNPRLKKEIESLKIKRKKILISDEQLIKTKDFNIRLFLDENIIGHDSAILIDNNSKKFFNLNDCKLFDKINYINKKYGKINIFTSQFSGATWHPHSYRYPKDKEIKISITKKTQKYLSLLKAINIIKSDYFIPSAGPPIFLDKKLEHISLNENSIFSNYQDFNKFLINKKVNSKILNLLPGTEINTKDKFKVRKIDKFAKFFLKNTKKKYLEWYREKVNLNFKTINKTKDSSNIIFKKLGKILKDKLKIIQNLNQIEGNLNIGLLSYSFVYKIDLKKKTIHKILKPNFSKNQYTVLFNESEIELLINNKINWPDICLTFRAKLLRKPDKYSTYINSFLFCTNDELKKISIYLVDLKKSKERITINTGGCQYEINRYCPHLGADLKYGYFNNGHWVCPKHGWRFSLENNGNLINDNSITINSINNEPES